MTRIAVFGYASLVSPASASHTLGRPVEGAALGRLAGWTRAWTLGREQAASEKTFARPDGTLPAFCLGLNLEPADGAEAPNGVLIEVSEAELDRLDVREIRYHRTDVTAAVALDDGSSPEFDAVCTYIAKPEHHHPTPPADSIIVATYPETIEAAFAALGPDHLDRYRRTTAPPPVEVTPATLVRGEIPAGNPRAW